MITTTCIHVCFYGKLSLNYHQIPTISVKNMNAYQKIPPLHTKQTVWDKDRHHYHWTLALANNICNPLFSSIWKPSLLYIGDISTRGYIVHVGNMALLKFPGNSGPQGWDFCQRKAENQSEWSFEPAHEIMVLITQAIQQRLRQACTSAQSRQSLCCSHTWKYGSRRRVQPKIW